jgi:hypothetical protein
MCVGGWRDVEAPSTSKPSDKVVVLGVGADPKPGDVTVVLIGEHAIVNAYPCGIVSCFAP